MLSEYLEKSQILQAAHYWQWGLALATAALMVTLEWFSRHKNTLFARLLPPLAGLAVLLASMFTARFFGHSYVAVLRSAAVLAGTLLLSRLAVYIVRQTFHAQQARAAGVFASFERWIALSLWLLAVLVITDAGQVVWAWAHDIELPIGKSHVTLAEALVAATSAAITVLLALWLASVIEGRLNQAHGLEANTRVVLSRFAKALLLVVGVVSGLAVGGIDLTLLSVLFGALGVGLGFGLQKIAANYISGFIVLIDRGIKIGDLITVDKYYGQVTHINSRFTVIQTFEGTEALIPNELLVSTPIVNHSFTNSKVRVQLLITVASDTDLDVCIPLLESIAAQHPRVIQAPEVAAVFKSFVDNGLALELNFWIEDPQNGQGNVRSDIARDVLKSLRNHNITVPYPQQVVHQA